MAFLSWNAYYISDFHLFQAVSCYYKYAEDMCHRVMSKSTLGKRSELSFHKFPKDKRLISLWKQKCSRRDLYVNPGTPHGMFCSELTISILKTFGISSGHSSCQKSSIRYWRRMWCRVWSCLPTIHSKYPPFIHISVSVVLKVLKCIFSTYSSNDH